MDWTTGALTTTEAQKALRKAGLSIDPNSWTPSQMWKAGQVLNEAKKVKLAKLGFALN